MGNSCRVTLVQLGRDEFQLEIQEFNDLIPVMFRGRLGLMTNKGELWIDSKKRDGFTETLQSYNPHGTRES